MKRIVVLDTSASSKNLGDKIIMDAVDKELRELFPSDFFYHVPTHEYVRAGRRLIEKADQVFLGGTNCLRSDMNSKVRDWQVSPTDILWMKNVTLVGVGWWQYQVQSFNLFAQLFLKKVLHRQHYQSLRDSYTANRLKTLGFKVLNTGCPTMWRLSKEHCRAVPTSKGERAVLTFTAWQANINTDKFLFDTVSKNYTTVYFWPQMYEDYNYAKKICGSGAIFLDPSMEAYDDLLKEDIDYIGTRLHAGLRALQHKRRAIIVATDNRSMEMGRDFNLPIMFRENISSELENRINTSWTTQIALDDQAIAAWKNQFRALNK